MILIYLPKSKINHFDFWESATVCNDDHLIVRDSDALINLFDDLSIDLLPSEKDSPTLTQIRALQAEILDCDCYLLIMNISYPYLDFPALIDENRSPNSDDEMALLVTDAALDEEDLIRRGLVGPEEASVKNPDHDNEVELLDASFDQLVQQGSLPAEEEEVEALQIDDRFNNIAAVLSSCTSVEQKKAFWDDLAHRIVAEMAANQNELRSMISPIMECLGNEGEDDGVKWTCMSYMSILLQYSEGGDLSSQEIDQLIPLIVTADGLENEEVIREVMKIFANLDRSGFQRGWDVMEENCGVYHARLLENFLLGSLGDIFSQNVSSKLIAYHCFRRIEKGGWQELEVQLQSNLRKGNVVLVRGTLKTIEKFADCCLVQGSFYMKDLVSNFFDDIFAIVTNGRSNEAVKCLESIMLCEPKCIMNEETREMLREILLKSLPCMEESMSEEVSRVILPRLNARRRNIGGKLPPGSSIVTKGSQCFDLYKMEQVLMMLAFTSLGELVLMMEQE
ncbi:hypothetical protein RHMOL_Rhmol03G0121600 [Rhododendron molle]|uniref:Uncharacterized protein n=1 Tax=Rhododendron molle TaxID=49168 RepID=A0ACC0PEM0_RHOML|nr:hypothetical protein RHMOL_Rhmol03G0121600 [Rhododendron molle]